MGDHVSPILMRIGVRPSLIAVSRVLQLWVATSQYSTQSNAAVAEDARNSSLMVCRLGLREHLSEDVYLTLRVCLNKPSQTHSIYSQKSLGRIVAPADWMNRDTTCRSLRPLRCSRNGEACTVRGFASLQASSEQGVVG